jgi:hypothetical protein
MNILYVLLKNGTRLISQVEQLTTVEMGDPDCKLSNPFVISSNINVGGGPVFSPWESDYTNDNEFIIRSEDILLMQKPKPELVKRYLKLLSDMINGEVIVDNPPHHPV